MAPNIKALDRLKSQLLTSGLQERNNALFQVINQLIDYLRQGIDSVQSQINAAGSGSGGGGGGGSTITIVNGSIIPRDGEDGSDGFSIVGPPGPPGPIGPMGFPGIDGNSDDWSIPFIGNVLLKTTGTYTQVIP